MSPRRKLPPLISDHDRIEAASIAAWLLSGIMREASLFRATWNEEPVDWDHHWRSDGLIVSEKR